MILCSLQNTATFSGNWLQKRPYITQGFGERPEVYAQFGIKGHNGIDYRAAVGTTLHAPIGGVVRVSDQGGYGVHVKIRNPYTLLECVLGHLSRTGLKTGDEIRMGDIVGYSGNTGFSSGPHVHEGLRGLLKSDKDIFTWQVENYDNGYFGYFDHSPYTITWKGTVRKNDL